MTTGDALAIRRRRMLAAFRGSPEQIGTTRYPFGYDVKTRRGMPDPATRVRGPVRETDPVRLDDDP